MNAVQAPSKKFDAWIQGGGKFALATGLSSRKRGERPCGLRTCSSALPRLQTSCRRSSTRGSARTRRASGARLRSRSLNAVRSAIRRAGKLPSLRRSAVRAVDRTWSEQPALLGKDLDFDAETSLLYGSRYLRPMSGHYECGWTIRRVLVNQLRSARGPASSSRQR